MHSVLTDWHPPTGMAPILYVWSSVKSAELSGIRTLIERVGIRMIQYFLLSI